MEKNTLLTKEQKETLYNKFKLDLSIAISDLEKYILNTEEYKNKYKELYTEALAKVKEDREKELNKILKAKEIDEKINDFIEEYKESYFETRKHVYKQKIKDSRIEYLKDDKETLNIAEESANLLVRQELCIDSIVSETINMLDNKLRNYLNFSTFQDYESISEFISSKINFKQEAIENYNFLKDLIKEYSIDVLYN